MQYTNPFLTADGQAVEKGKDYWTHYVGSGPGPTRVTVLEDQHREYCQQNVPPARRRTGKCGCDGFVRCLWTDTDGKNHQTSLDGTRLTKNKY